MTFARRLLFEALEDRRLLAVLTVQNDLDDTLVNLAGDGELSLREAIEVANNPGTTIDGFSSNDVDDTIQFDAQISGKTITLSGMELVLSESITIDASSLHEKITIDANQQSRVINIDTELGDYALHNLIITGGQTVENGTFSDRTRGVGGGIRSLTKGTLAIYDSEVVHNRTLGSSASGGGIYSGEGKLALHNSTVSYNTAANGAGGGVAAGARYLTPDDVIESAGELTLVKSAITNNRALSSWGTGGGVLSLADTTLFNSTVSGNLAEGSFGSGGIHHSATNLNIESSTVTDNQATSLSHQAVGGGISTGAKELTILNSIIAGNSSVVSRNDLSSSDPALASIQIDHSLIGDTTGTSIDTNTGVGNILDVDPLLGPLADNGGPTQTHALLAGSPAIDAGDPNIAMPPTHDQRGEPFVRIADGNGNSTAVLDMGAFEVPATLVVDTEEDIVDEFDGLTSLREAISTANLFAEPNNIIFDNSLAGETVLLDGSELLITDSLTIDASSLSEKLTIDANQRSRVVNIDTELGDFALHGLEITGGRTIEDSISLSSTPGSGGGIRFIANGSLIVNQTIVRNNLTEGFDSEGGGIFVGAGKLLVYRSSIQNNSTQDASGGGIASRGDFFASAAEIGRGEIIIIQSTISENRSFGFHSGTGGGIHTFAKKLTLLDSTVSDNLARGESGGGGIHHSEFKLTIERSTISDNRSLGVYENAPGGGILASSEIAVSNSIIAGNASSFGQQDIAVIGNAAPQINHSLIGDTTGTSIDANTGVGNILDVDPLLGPLADNGGPTQTHALLPGSPALDAGDASIQPARNLFDQRGVPFSRVAAGTLLGIPQQVIDIGAYEAQFPPSADFAENGRIDGGDFLAWQRGFGKTDAATRADGNSDDDTDVDQSDFGAWKTTYGQSEAPPPPESSGASAELIDAALSVALFTSKEEERSALVGSHRVVDETFSSVAFAAPQILLVNDTVELPQRYATEPEVASSEIWESEDLLESVFE